MDSKMNQTKFDFCMIDLETMGGVPRGALVGLGAVLFDLPTCTLGPTFYRPVHLATSVDIGMEMDASTVLFWLKQSQEAREAIMFSLVDIRVALMNFTTWIEEHSDIETVKVYGNGATFDLTILGEAYKLAGIHRPWRWGNERCFRTIRNQYPQVVYDVNDKKGTAHNAVDDAIFQAEHLFKIKNRNKK